MNRKIDPMADQNPTRTNIVQTVCARPMIFTATGTLPEVIAFLTGFDVGQSSHRNDQSARIVLDWLIKDFKHFPPNERLPRAMQRLGDTEQALSALSEFAATIEDSPNAT